MKNSRTIINGCILTAGIVLFTLLCLHAFQRGEETIRLKAQAAFEEAIDIDFHRRLDAQSNHRPRPLNPRQRDASHRAAQVVEVLEFRKDTIEAYQAEQSVLQNLLAESHPLCPDSFDSLFRERLSKQGLMPMKTGVLYTYKGKKQYSRNDSTVLSSATLLPPRTLDAKHSICLQVGFKPEWRIVLAQLPDITIGSIIACLLVLCIVYLLLIKEYRKQKWLMPFGEPEQFGRLVLYKESNQAYINGRPCPMKRADFELLRLFVQTPSHTLGKEDIKKAFWPKEDNPENKIYYHISMLKAALKAFPEYQIMLDEEKKYRLVQGKKKIVHPANCPIQPKCLPLQHSKAMVWTTSIDPK